MLWSVLGEKNHQRYHPAMNFLSYSDDLLGEKMGTIQQCHDGYNKVLSDWITAYSTGEGGDHSSYCKPDQNPAGGMF